jgi:hypothetical protein
MLKVSGSIPRFLFHFLMTLLQRIKTMLKAYVIFFNEFATKKRNYAHSFFLIMASKRIMVWQETMSRDKNRSWIPRDFHWMEESS